MAAVPGRTPPPAASADRIRRFVVELDTPLAPPGRHRYASPDDAAGVPVAEAVFGVPGVVEFFIEGNAVTVLRAEAASWEQLEEPVRYAISAALRGGAAGAPPPDAAGTLSDDELYDAAERLLHRDINPAVAQHGGAVELLDVQDGVIAVRMMGGCQGCGMANVTLRQGIEQTFRRALPGFRAIRDITDHAAGETPYFKAPPPSDGLPVLG